MPNWNKWSVRGGAIFFIPTLCLVFALFWRLAELGPSGYLLQETVSPSHIGRAMVVSDGGSFAGQSVWVYVRDPAVHAGNPLLLGGPYASDGDVKMMRTVWSRDGTLLAIWAQVGKSGGHHFQRFDGVFFVSGYDYREHRLISGNTSYRERSKTISHLFVARGGVGLQDLTTPYMADGKPLSRSEAQKFPR